ncbi:MAG: hypothetical protein IJD46_01485 [Bacilli bacterium]|nr:hypothetical protein [Bacilli bacterium]
MENNIKDLNLLSKEELLDLLEKIDNSENECYEGIYLLNVYTRLSEEEKDAFVTKRLDNKKNVVHLIVFLSKATLSKYATRFIEKQDFNVSPFMVFFAKEDADRVNKFAKENNIKLNVIDTINITIK